MKGTDAVLKIELSGANTEVVLLPEGLVIGAGASNSVVKGLVINRFGGTGIKLSGSNNKVEGNFIGTNVAGTADLGNIHRGVDIGDGTAGNIIGGTSPAARNVISGNDSPGVVIHHSGSNKIEGNLIGTSNDGSAPLGNGSHGVLVAGNNNIVGGTTSGAANVIAHNHLDGVSVSSGTGNRILSNSIFSNDEPGINLVGGSESIYVIEGADGFTANDPGDPDTGPNGLQNKPVLISATTSGGETTVKGKLNSKANKTFTLQFISNPPNTAEGKKFMGQKSVSTNANGNTGIFTFVPNQVVPVGKRITATATDPGGNTSEFSLGRSVAQQ